MKFFHKPLRHFCIAAVLCAGTLQMLPSAHARGYFHACNARAQHAAEYTKSPSVVMREAVLEFMAMLRGMSF